MSEDRESGWEAREARRLAGDGGALRAFWDERHRDDYGSRLEEPAEIGRHGVIAEHVTRLLGHGSVLDVGCGGGILSELLDSRRFAYHGINVSEAAITQARARRGQHGGRFTCRTFEDFDATEPLDCVVLNEVLYYFNVERALAKAVGMLSPRGLLVVSLFACEDGDRILPAVRSALAAPIETVIENPAAGLRWTITAGRPRA